MSVGDLLDHLGIAPKDKVDVVLLPIFRTFDDPFGSPSATTLVKTLKLQAALNAAIAEVADAHDHQQPKDPRDPADLTAFPIPFTIADVTDAPAFPVASYNGTEVDFIASEAKVAALFAAMELRAMVRRFAATFGITKKKDLFPELRRRVDPLINDAVPLLKAGKDVNGHRIRVTDADRLPHYERVFHVTEVGGALQIDFDGEVKSEPARRNADFGHALFDMIANSGDDTAAKCIRGVGLSFMNGALFTGGFFERDNTDPKKSKGTWLSSDFLSPVDFRCVMSANDGPAKIAGTTDTLVRLLTLIRLGTFADPADPGGDLPSTLLGQSIDGAFKPILRNHLTHGKYVRNKLGWAPLGRNPRTSRWVASELSLIKDVEHVGKLYAVAYQNWEMKLIRHRTGDEVVAARDSTGRQLYMHADMAKIIERTVHVYES